MTGTSKINRQLSSNVGQSNVEEKTRPKYRRCSSADEHNVGLRPILDETFFKHKLENKGRQTPSDIDSGTEDFEQQVLPSSNHSEKNDDEENGAFDFAPCVDDEGFAETRLQTPVNEPVAEPNVEDDLQMAALIPHEDKKNFCQDTMFVFHAEFARSISLPILLKFPNLAYHLFAMEELPHEIQTFIMFNAVSCPFNAKAQFKCTGCKRLWTSMRARIDFRVTQPGPFGLIALEIFGQNCQNCGAEGEALWYMEEVCRVMAELANTIYENYFPNVFEPIPTIVTEQMTTPSRWNFYNPNQRRGKMSAPHDQQRCAACRAGKCFPSRV